VDFDTNGARLRKGETLSCGCLARELTSKRATKHGKRNSVVYHAWAAMIARCENPNHYAWKDYGGRGIRVCGRWRNSFELFYADMGDPPPGLSIDRFPDKNGNYEPSNCRWATWIEQHNNRRNNKLIDYKGEQITAPALARRLGVSRDLIEYRIKVGKSLEDLCHPI
jgi:hypothetical protein